MGDPEPYTEAEKAAADRLGMTLYELRQILDVYMEECRKIALERREKAQSNPAYQAYLKRKEKHDGSDGRQGGS